jgi:threonine efflux protein
VETLHAAATVAAVCLVAMMVPGPDVLVVTNRTIAGGRQSGVQTALGVVAGNVVWASVALLGATAIFELFPTWYLAFKVAGAAYVVYLGVQMIRAARDPLADAVLPRAPRASFRTGLVTCLANPKAAVFYASVLTSVAPRSPSLPVFLALLATITMVAVGWFVTVAVGLSTPRASAFLERWKARIETVSGALFVGLGGWRLVEDVRHALR